MMAADSRCVFGDKSFFPTEKLLRHDGAIYGAAGNGEDCQKYLLWVQGKLRRRPKVSGSFHALMLNSKGLFVVGCTLDIDLVKDGYYAIGSGDDLAMGSLATQRFLGLNMDPRLAVRVACERDAGSSLPVDFLTLKREGYA